MPAQMRPNVIIHHDIRVNHSNLREPTVRLDSFDPFHSCCTSPWRFHSSESCCKIHMGYGGLRALNSQKLSSSAHLRQVILGKNFPPWKKFISKNVSLLIYNIFLVISPIFQGHVITELELKGIQIDQSSEGYMTSPGLEQRNWLTLIFPSDSERTIVILSSTQNPCPCQSFWGLGSRAGAATYYPCNHGQSILAPQAPVLWLVGWN